MSLTVIIIVLKMKTKKRFFLLFFVAFLALIHFGGHLKRPRDQQSIENSKDFYSSRDLKREFKEKKNNEVLSCRMNSCFNLSRCLESREKGLKIHIYPNLARNDSSQQLSESFVKIIEILRNSVFFESNPNKACLFLASTWDTLDRDPLSRDFQRPHPQMARVDPLFGGENHLLFNLYSGSWPQYTELDFAFNNNFAKIKEILPKAILVKASQSRDSYRKDFDVSLPLFSRSHPMRGQHSQSSLLIGQKDNSNSKQIILNNLIKREKRLLVFKGKRYIYGIGSETRNSLHYLNNDKDVLVLTTCKHGKKFKDFDQKCEKDNTLYDKHDYLELMANSTFCLVPRGRRLGSYRFLESLQLGCIPVVLSNSWILPFEELIDWNQCIVRADERLLLQIPETLRSFSDLQIETMRHKCLHYYETFFSSVETIVFSSLLIIENRIHSHLREEHFSRSLLPLWQMSSLSPPLSETQLTAIILVESQNELLELQKLQNRLLVMPLIKEIIIVWSLSGLSSLKQLPKRVRLVYGENRFAVKSETIKTQCVLQLSPNSNLIEDEISFGFGVWKEFPKRIIGFIGRSHYYSSSEWRLSSKWTNHYSLVELDSSFYSKHFHTLFLSVLEKECPDLSFLLLISHITREGPLKVSQRKAKNDKSYSNWIQSQQCLSRLVKHYSYQPLIVSQLRLDPLLFRDNVSVKRKKFVKME